MSSIAVKGADTGTGVFTIESPATNTDRVLTLPDEAGTILTSGGAIDVDASAPADSVAVDASGNLLVGTTSTSTVDTGFRYLTSSDSIASVTNDASSTVPAAYFGRNNGSGQIVRFRQGSTTVGSIGVDSGNNLYLTALATNHAGLYFADNGSQAAVLPMSSGNVTDNATDLGSGSFRFDDVFATNGTIQTSDAREKENIASLTPAEMAVGKRLSSLFKTFTWVDKTRTHSGIIAQDVKAAFEAEGLDAGKYALFIHAEWTDEETGEQRDRMGIRYPELLSFVAAYNDQRFAAIEARLDALEGGA